MPDRKPSDADPDAVDALADLIVWEFDSGESEPYAIAAAIVAKGWRPPAEAVPTVDRELKAVADMVWMSDTAHPKGYVLTSSLRMRRALWAYQWAAQNQQAEHGYVLMPSPAATCEAMRAWEATDD